MRYSTHTITVGVRCTSRSRMPRHWPMRRDPATRDTSPVAHVASPDPAHCALRGHQGSVFVCAAMARSALRSQRMLATSHAWATSLWEHSFIVRRWRATSKAERCGFRSQHDYASMHDQTPCIRTPLYHNKKIEARAPATNHCARGVVDGCACASFLFSVLWPSR